MELLEFLQKWYSEQCDGDWEHMNGVRIDTLDNPGWSVDIQLEGTDLQDQRFETRTVKRGDKGWLDCWVENRTFKGRGGPQNLVDILGLFRQWAENVRRSKQVGLD